MLFLGGAILNKKRIRIGLLVKILLPNIIKNMLKAMIVTFILMITTIIFYL